MNKVDLLTKGALLHDIGKICLRADHSLGNHSQAGAGYLKRFLPATQEAESLLNCIKYHHASALRGAKLAKNDLSYLVYEADNIAAGTDRRDIEGESKGFDAQSCLESIFNIFGGAQSAKVGKYHLQGMDADKHFNYPTKAVCMASDSTYENLVEYLTSNFQRANILDMQCNELLRIMEDLSSYVPSSTNRGEVCDISLYVHSKVTAAIASCMYQYFQAEGIDDYQAACVKGCQSTREEKAYLLVSGDISGIQSFIYTIPSNGALKSLRGRSFYLELLMEDFIDELLTKLGLSRANLLYTGGGHFYMLAANTAESRAVLQQLQNACNEWLLERFGVALYMALGYAECSANDLLNSGKQRNIFAAVTEALNRDKLCRYDEAALGRLFTVDTADDGRECSICHKSSKFLVINKNVSDGPICPMCNGLFKLGGKSLNDDAVFVITEKPQNEGIEIFGYGQKQYLCVAAANRLEKMSDIVRVYTKNSSLTGKYVSTRLWMADYSVKNEHNDTMQFAELAAASCGEKNGINRLGVLRADVDNLGAAFIGGFIDYAAEDKLKYATLSRHADLSRDLTMFFKRAVNLVCKGDLVRDGSNAKEQFGLFAKRQAMPRRVHIVYSGGDDMFLVGAWDELLEVAVDIRQAFRDFTGGKLTFSAGLALFNDRYPVSRMAELTGMLEDEAKSVPDKDSIALFGFDTEQKSDKERLVCQHVYRWSQFTDEVCAEKLHFLLEHLDFEQQAVNKLAVGKTLLYRLLELLDDSENKRMNIARFAYTLSRMQPKDNRLMPVFNEFQEQMFKWIKNAADCRQLRTAIDLLIYYLREKGEMQ